MTVVWILFGLGSGLVLLGLNHLWTPLDELWKRQEQRLLARGLAPQRNAAWDKGAYAGAWVALSAGAFLLVVNFGLWRAVASVPPRMSGVTINGRQLTEPEYNAFGQDLQACVMDEAIRKQEGS